MDNDKQMMKQIMTQAAWPNHSANLYDRIILRTMDIVPPAFMLPMPGWRFSSLAFAALVAGFCIGILLNDSSVTAEQSFAYFSTDSITDNILGS
jgi:hypothetical protein